MLEDDKATLGVANYYSESSPTHVAPSSNRVQSAPVPPRNVYTHRRRDSDTLRSDMLVNPSVPNRDNMEPPPARSSPPNRNGAGSRQSMRHRRSPTAPEHPTSSAALAHDARRDVIAGKTWASGERGPQENERERLPEDAIGPVKQTPAPQVQVQHTSASMQPPQADVRMRLMSVSAL